MHGSGTGFQSGAAAREIFEKMGLNKKPKIKGPSVYDFKPENKPVSFSITDHRKKL
jgi:hypothetical protein